MARQSLPLLKTRMVTGSSSSKKARHDLDGYIFAKLAEGVRMKTIAIVMMGMLLLAGCATQSYNDKVVVCHKGKTLEVGSSALDAHLRHGDDRGACR
jgi:hypothetical protein